MVHGPPPTIQEKARPDKASARPRYNATLVQTHGPWSARKLPERALVLQKETAVAEPHKQTGLKRFDDQRPNTYVSEHKFMNLKNAVQTTLVVEPHTSWGDTVERHRSPIGMRNIENGREDLKLAGSEITGARIEPFGEPVGVPFGYPTLLQCGEPRNVKYLDPQPDFFEYTNGGHIPPKITTVPRSAHRSLAGLYDERTLRQRARIDLYQSTPSGDKLANQMRSVESQHRHLLARRQWFSRDPRKNNVWPNGKFRHFGMLSDTEVRSASCNARIHDSCWKHRLPFLEITQQSVRNPAQAQFDDHAQRLLTDVRGYSRAIPVRERSAPVM
ncbi:unnamed protein product [Amoebophrya sp. A25]|nr:unnamed protein product [Amoebophrya sp. A25]|eukprot:GSA25T00016712001.1